jgi:hypothetical protein
VQTAEAGKLVQAVEKKFKLVHQGRPAYTLRIDGSMQVVKESDFKEDRGKEQHVVRELRAILEFLQNRRSELEGKESCRIVWRTKSFATVCCLKKGSKIMEAQKGLVNIKMEEKRLGVRVVGVWEAADVSTEELCQKLSRSTDEWGLERAEQVKLFAELNFIPDVDCMATPSSSVCQKFFAKGISREAVGQDFFAQKLQPGVKYYCCPPVREAFRAGLFLASQEDVQCSLVVQAWISAPFSAGLQNNKKFKNCVVREKMFKSKFVTFNQADSVFGRNSTINMMAFLLETKVRY